MITLLFATTGGSFVLSGAGSGGLIASQVACCNAPCWPTSNNGWKAGYLQPTALISSLEGQSESFIVISSVHLEKTCGSKERKGP